MRGRLVPGARGRVVLVVLLVVLAALPALFTPLTSDEAGLTLVADRLAPTVGSLYGPYWVDRPPSLIGTYRVAQDLLGLVGPRVLAVVGMGLMILLVRDLVRTVAGRSAADVAAVATALLYANPAFTAYTAKSEVLGTPFVALSAWAAVRASRAGTTRSTLALGLLAGAAATCAITFKQSLVGGFTFGALVLVGSLLGRGPEKPTRPLVSLGAFAVGAAVPVAATVGWVVAVGADLRTAWYQVVTFRVDASEVIAAGSTAAPTGRALDLVGIFVVTGMAVVVVAALVAAPWRSARLRLVSVAALGTVAVDLVALSAGGSYWRSYLIPLIPWCGLLLGLAWAAAGDRTRPRVRAVGGLLAVATAGSVVLALVHPVTLAGSEENYRVGQAVGESAQPSDTVVSLFGHAEVVQASGLRSTYPHLWSLPARVLDPSFDTLTAQLDRGEPTWVVQVLPLGSWADDGGDDLRRALEDGYRVRATTCEVVIWLEKGVDRPRPRVPDCERPWSFARDSLTPRPSSEPPSSGPPSAEPPSAGLTR